LRPELGDPAAAQMQPQSCALSNFKNLSAAGEFVCGLSVLAWNVAAIYRCPRDPSVRGWPTDRSASTLAPKTLLGSAGVHVSRIYSAAQGLRRKYSHVRQFWALLSLLVKQLLFLQLLLYLEIFCANTFTPHIILLRPSEDLQNLNAQAVLWGEKKVLSTSPSLGTSV